MKFVKGALFVVVVLLAAVYGCDYAVLRYRIARNHNAFDSVTVQKFYAIKEKTGKTEFSTGDSEDVTCANTLFPHSGYTPCWYLRRHTEQQINI